MTLIEGSVLKLDVLLNSLTLEVCCVFFCVIRLLKVAGGGDVWVCTLHRDASFAKRRLADEAVDEHTVAVSTLLLRRSQHVVQTILVRAVQLLTLTAVTLSNDFVVGELKQGITFVTRSSKMVLISAWALRLQCAVLRRLKCSCTAAVLRASALWLQCAGFAQTNISYASRLESAVCSFNKCVCAMVTVRCLPAIEVFMHFT